MLVGEHEIDVAAEAQPSVDVQAADRRNLTALGANGFIAKPFDPLLLADQVSEIASW